MPEGLLSAAHVAERCALSTRAIYRAVERGELRASRLCGRLRIAPEAVEEWIIASVIEPDRGSMPAAGAPKPLAPAGRLRTALDEERAA